MKNVVIKIYKPKGTIVKKVRHIYYVYKATSKRVPGKSYRVQVIEGLVGKIDENGFYKSFNTYMINIKQHRLWHDWKDRNNR